MVSFVLAEYPLGCLAYTLPEADSRIAYLRKRYPAANGHGVPVFGLPKEATRSLPAKSNGGFGAVARIRTAYTKWPYKALQSRRSQPKVIYRCNEFHFGLKRIDILQYDLKGCMRISNESCQNFLFAVR